MAHNLFGSRFVGARTPAWHQFGTVIPDGEEITVADALARGAIDFTYQTVPVGYTHPDGAFVHSGESNMILRSPTTDDPIWRELGIVSADYNVVQNDVLARGLDRLSTATGWKFETVGALAHGATVFLTLRTGQASVFGDEYNTYVIVSDGKGNGRGLQIFVAAERVVCENTLLMSDRSATTKITIAHDADVEGEYDFFINVISGLEESRRVMFANLHTLGETKITDAKAKEIFRRAYPDPQRTAQRQMVDAIEGGLDSFREIGNPEVVAKLERGEEIYEWTKLRMAARRDAAFTLYERFNAGEEQGSISNGGIRMPDEALKQLSQTPYAAYQAVTELVDWGGNTTSASKSANLIFGEGAATKRRAFTAAMAAVKK